MLYFSYGSNMSYRRLSQRTPSAEFVCVATLSHHRLRFHKTGRDRSAKCDALFTGKAEDVVFGVVFRIAPAERRHLDHAEGLGQGYEAKKVALISAAREPVEAFTYYATAIDPSLLPYHWYKQHVLIGCRENRLPPAYVDQIASIASIEDPDTERALREMSIHLA
jgi:hypothetical protein